MRGTALRAFVAFHVLVIVSWGMPTETLVGKALNRSIEPYMLFTGLWQNWSMFAPDPRRFDCYLTAKLRFKDGMESLWEFPRMDKMGPVEAYFKERYRKWACDNLRLDTQRGTWSEASRYIARLNQTDPANPVTQVELIRSWADIPPPAWAEGSRSPAGEAAAAQPGARDWKHFTFHTEKLEP